MCQSNLNDEKAICVIDTMGCEVPDTSYEEDQFEETDIPTPSTEAANQGSSGTTLYENPDGNTFFCG